MTTSTTPSSAGTATTSSALPLTNLVNTHSATTQSSTQHQTTSPSKSPNKSSVTSKARQWLWSRSRKAVGVLISPVKKVFKSFEKTTSIFGLLLSLLFGPLGFVAIKIAIWQSLKDWYLYCLEQKKLDEMKAVTRLKCEKTLQEGLPPPPFSVFRRSVISGGHHTSLHARSLTNDQATGIRGSPLVSVYEQHVRGRFSLKPREIIGLLVPLALVVFILTVLAIRLARRGWRRLRIRASTTPKTVYQRSAFSLCTGISILLSIVGIILAVAQLIAGWHQSAERDYLEYCQLVPEQQRSGTCADAIKKTEQGSTHSSMHFMHNFTALTIAAALLIAVAAMVWIFTLADMRLIKKLRRIVRARFGWTLDPEEPQEHSLRGKHVVKCSPFYIGMTKDDDPSPAKPCGEDLSREAASIEDKIAGEPTEILMPGMERSAISWTKDATLLFEQERRSRRDARNLVRKMAQQMPQLESQEDEQALEWDFNTDDEDDEQTWWMESDRDGQDQPFRHRRSY